MELPRWVEDERDSLLREVADYRDLSPEERGRLLAAACRAAARVLRSRPDRDLALETLDPLPESTIKALARLRREAQRGQDRGHDEPAT